MAWISEISSKHTAPTAILASCILSRDLVKVGRMSMSLLEIKLFIQFLALCEGSPVGSARLFAMQYMFIITSAPQSYRFCCCGTSEQQMNVHSSSLVDKDATA